MDLKIHIWEYEKEYESFLAFAIAETKEDAIIELTGQGIRADRLELGHYYVYNLKDEKTIEGLAFCMSHSG